MSDVNQNGSPHAECDADVPLQAVALKTEANKAFSAKDYINATKLYSDAIALDTTSHVLWSNRSASKAGQRDWHGALDDAEKVGYLAKE